MPAPKPPPTTAAVVPGLLPNPFSFLTFWWVGRVLSQGWRHPLTLDDLPRLPPQLTTAGALPAFEAAFAARAATAARAPGRALGGALLSVNRTLALTSLALQVLQSGLQLAGPLLLKRVVTHLQGGGVSTRDAYISAGLMFALPLVGAVAFTQSSRAAAEVQVRLKAVLTAAVFRKAGRLSPAARRRADTDAGRVVNLASADVSCVAQFAYPFANQLVSAPLMLAATLALLVLQISWAAVIGLAVLLAASPTSTLCVKRITVLRRAMLGHTDARVRGIGQLISGVRVLKLYGWTGAQADQVGRARADELGTLRRAVPYRVGMSTLLFAAPVLAAVASFAAFGSAAPTRFTPAVVFSSLALFSLSRIPLILLPFAAVEAGNALVSLRRLGAFLTLEDRVDSVAPLPTPGIRFDNAVLHWPPDDDGVGDGGAAAAPGANAAPDSATPSTVAPPRPADAATAPGAVAVDLDASAASTPPPLSGLPSRASTRYGAAAPAGLEGPPGAYWLVDVDLAVAPGELVCVVGRVGAGKSSLLAAALGNMVLADGTVAVGGRVAYASQQPFIVSGSVRENVVLFGPGGVADPDARPVDEARYAAALDAAVLGPDLAVLPAGDATEIGERGVNLSGGQKARCALARIMYGDADVVVLDDVLSAVDVHVAAALTDRLIGALVRAGKCVLLATNQLAVLARATRIVYLENGRVAAVADSVEALRRRSDGFAALVADHEATMTAASEAAAAAGAGDNDASNDDASDPATLRARLGAALLPRATRPEEQLQLGRAPSDPPAGGSPRADDTPRAAAARALQRVPTAVLAREARVEALHDGAQRGGGLSLPDLESVVRAGDSDGDDSDALTAADASVGRPSFSSVAGGSPRAAAAGRSRFSLSSVRRPSLSSAGGGRGGTPPPPAPAPAAATAAKAAGAALVTVEDREAGAVSAGVYAFYAARYSVVAVAALVSILAAEQTTRLLTNVWLARWTGQETASAAGTAPPVNRALKLGVYFGISLAFVAATASRTATNLLAGLRASGRIHADALRAVARSPVLFFDQTPAGRLLNRFSKDTDDMDSLLPQAINEFGNCLMTIVATLIFEAVIQPYFLVGAIPALALYYWVQRFYRASYVECQRTDAVTRSPVFSNLSQAVAGVDTIRADAAGPAAFAARSDALVDANNTAFFSVRSSEQWLSLRLEVLSACLVCLVAALATATAGRIPASLAALALSEALDLTGFLKYWVNAAAGLENRLNSVERLRAVTTLPPEAADGRDGDAALVAAGWPTRGALSFTDVWLTYRAGLDPALRGVTFDVPAGAKVGVCGRTGSGKSSLVVALYRLTEPTSGRVAVDGVDLASVGLATLRQRLGCIPQDPILFSGTVRYNLDPYDQHTDAAVWAALEVVSLKDVVREGPLGLSEKVVEGGDNWSVGQRQLLCVARAVLRGSKLLVADEATASVDAESDAAIQRALRVAFADATVLTVAHRVSTILDSDLIIVMDGGVVGEVGSVDALLGREGGAFRGLVEGAGH